MDPVPICCINKSWDFGVPLIYEAAVNTTQTQMLKWINPKLLKRHHEALSSFQFLLSNLHFMKYFPKGF